MPLFILGKLIINLPLCFGMDFLTPTRPVERFLLSVTAIALLSVIYWKAGKPTALRAAPSSVPTLQSS